VSGGIARSDLMCEILASVLNRPLERLVSAEGPALGAAVAALAGLETHLRQKAGIRDSYTVADAVATLVRFRDPVAPRPDWVPQYADGLKRFKARVSSSA
jgi:sugar (pentulose or hexulose) kinase